jgi:GNAT superfamily N-acetyltransferase
VKEIWMIFNRFFRVNCEEFSSVEKYTIFFSEANKNVEGTTINPDTIHLVKKEDNFVSPYFRRLSKTLLERGDIGLGYYIENCLVGFLWIRRGKFSEQVGRECIAIPEDYCVLHHLVIEFDYRGKGIGKSLLKNYVSSISPEFHLSRTIAFVKSDNIISAKAFTSAGFFRRGFTSSKRWLGKRFFRIETPGISLSKGSNKEYRSTGARSIDLPFQLLSTPYLNKEESLIKGVIGGRPWISILSATVLQNSIPGILHAPTGVGTPILMPCSISPGNTLGKFRIKIDPTKFQSWPDEKDYTNCEIISAIAKVSRSEWIESLDWPLPFWTNDSLSDLDLPKGCIRTRIDDSCWIMNLSDCRDSPEIFYSKTARTYIRQAEKRNVVICENPSEEDIFDFANLWLTNYKSRNWKGIQYNKLFFLALRNYIGSNDASIILAKVNDNVVAGGLFLRDMFGFNYILGALNREFEYSRAMYAIIHHMARKAASSGIQYINLGGNGGKTSLDDFKRHWGARTEEIYYLHCDNSIIHKSNPYKIIDKLYRGLIVFSFRLTIHKFRKIILNGI